MGIEIVKPTGDNSLAVPRFQVNDLAEPVFKTFNVPTMSIWMMTVAPGLPVFPWWHYAGAIDEDLNALNQAWNIPSPQGLFDCVALSHLVKFGGNNLFAIFNGAVKTMGWTALRPGDRETFTRGQGCIYHLFGAYEKKLSINWVPFWEPQSLVRNPAFGSLWRLFSCTTGDESTRCLTLFGLSNPRKLPEVVNLLISKDDRRSEKLVSLVDWFGMYSSPVDSKMGTCGIIYTQNKEVISKLSYLQMQMSGQLEQAKKELIAEPLPRTALRVMSRQIAL